MANFSMTPSKRDELKKKLPPNEGEQITEEQS